jgi:hypothetical protein
MARKLAVGEIQPGHIHTGQNHLFHDFLGLGGRPDRADELCLMDQQGHDDFEKANWRRRTPIGALN